MKLFTSIPVLFAISLSCGKSLAQEPTTTVTVVSVITINTGGVTTVTSCGCFSMCSDVTFPTAASGFNIIVGGSHHRLI
ncbi:hypothetical protein TWF694_006646 [Orbilia ellipsospora]|uniref:Uncharacterized protein n=1 Tax=Orbilia ellipsospora TaxID=2528407 RepID=A0AAV9XKR2_9PEZI